MRPRAIAFDPRTSHGWVLLSPEARQPGTLAEVDSKGNLIRRHSVDGADIAYSALDDCFWVTGQKLQKVDREGKVVTTAPFQFVNGSISIAVNEKDGSVWVAEREHPQVPGTKDRVLIFEPDGRLRKEVAVRVFCVTADSARGVTWVIGTWANQPRLHRIALDGRIEVSAPLSGYSLAIEPDTGYVWVAGRMTIDRVDREGRVVMTIGGGANAAQTQKWVAIVKE